MGRRKKAVKLEKHKNFQRRTGEGYDLAQRHNELFVKYYKGLGFVPEDEWEEFYTSLKNTLPVTFRITGYKSEAEELLKIIKGQFFSDLLNVKVDGQEIKAPKCLPWYPSELGWQLDLSRKMVRSNANLSKLHHFLISATECGAISRQEAVSMIPPLVLDIQSHHKVLDMCAAPGSKTAQLIEYLHSSAPRGELPTGYVMANDSNNKRCYMMVHQVKRLQSPCCCIVNHDATIFPKIRLTPETDDAKFQLFDRILCDVPCTGDGTMRKNFDVWGKWHPLQGANMHGLQLKILRRGCQLLELGGRLVYSTCSMNPVEDEAVIAEMLRSSDGAMRLVEVSDQLPGLRYTKGISNWKVMTKTGEWVPSKEEIPAALQTQFRQTTFPPTEEEAATFNLDRCMRILPHHQDTGGFFVAVLEKVEHLAGSREAKLAEKETEEASPANKEEDKEKTVGVKRSAGLCGEEPLPKKTRHFGFKEDPFLFMETSDPVWPPIKDFFGFPEKFPVEQLMFRSLQGKRSLYFVSKAIREIALFNEGRLKFVNMGVKTFTRSPSPLVPTCDFRITQECIGTILPYVGKRKVNINKQDAITSISEENPFTAKLSETAQTQLSSLDPGSSVFIYKPTEEDVSPKCEVVFCGWRGKTSVRCFGSRCDRAHALMLLGEDINEINKKVQEKKAMKKAEKEAEEAEEEQKNVDE